MKIIYLAGGCFWGVERYFSLAKGVLSTEVGYANGHKDNPSYQDLKSGLDDASETVKISYDENVVSLETISKNAWDIESYSTSENVWVFISYLRKKIEKIKSNVKIKSIRYQGYYLEYQND